MRHFSTGVLVVSALLLFAYGIMAQPPGGPGGRSGRGGFGPPRFPLMNTLDANRDGEISAAELANAPEALKKIDANQDGELTRDEMFGRPGGRVGPGGGGPRQGPRPGRPSAGESGELAFESAPVPKDDTEEKILAVLQDLDQNQRRGMMNVPEEDGRLLRLLTECIGAKNVVEIGTSNGYSGIWFSLALRTTDGKLTTYEIDARRASLARENFKRAGVDEYVTLVEGDAHEEIKKLTEPIDLLFLDADKEGYINYLDKLLPLVRPGGLIVAHNMNVRQAHPPFVKAITTNPGLETLFVHMDHAGVAISMKKR